MKKLLLSALAISLISCSDQEDLEQNISNETSNVEFLKATNSDQIDSEVFTKNMLGNGFSVNTSSHKSKEEIIAELTKTYKKAPTLHGPFTYTVPVPSPNPTGQSVTYRQVGNTYPATGVYYADIYQYYMKIELPAGAVASYINGIDNPGYSNWQSQTIGYNKTEATENGKNYLVANTYTMVLKYNTLGQLVNAVVPAASGPKTFSYSYFTL